MPKIVKIKLLVGGEEFLPNSGYSVTVEQSIGGHSSFRIAFPANATEGYGGALMDNALAFVGKKITIGVNDNQMEFKGVVTSVDLQKGIDAAGTIVLSGNGPAALLANSVQCLSYEEGTPLSQVATDTVNGHSTEHVKLSIGKGTEVSLPYTVQYNESDLSFLQRLCSRYGIWIYHNGTDFCVGKTGDKEVQGIYGQDVIGFNLSTGLREQSFGMKAQDWVNDTALESDSSAFSPTSSHPYQDRIKGESENVFAKKSSYDWTLGQHEYSAQGGVDTAAKVNVLGRAASMILASGTSELVNLRIGDTLSLQGLNFSDQTKQDPYGSYDITRIVHRFDHSGHYRNEFEGVPQGTEHLPHSNSFLTPQSGAQRGWVLDNADPNGLGRIKVQFPWQKPMGTSTPWIKMATPYSGSGKGFYFIPEKDEEVLVGFEGDNPEKPFVLSAGFNSSASSDFADADNNIKAIKTRSGHIIELNDTDGGESITIKDKNDNIFQIDTATNAITIVALDQMTLKSKNMNIQVEENLSVYVGGNKSEMVAKNNMLTTSEDYIVKASNIFETASEKIQSEADEIKRQAEKDITIHSTGGSINKKANKKINNNSGEVGNLF